MKNIYKNKATEDKNIFGGFSNYALKLWKLLIFPKQRTF